MKKQKIITEILILFFILIAIPNAFATPYIAANFGDLASANYDISKTTINDGEMQAYSFSIIHDYGTESSEIQVKLFNVDTNEYLGTIYEKTFVPTSNNLIDLVLTEENLEILKENYNGQGNFLINIGVEQKIKGETQSSANFAQLELEIKNVADLQNPIADFIYYPENPKTGEGIIFISNSTDLDGTIVAYEWKVNGLFITKNDEMSITFDNEGIYNISLTVTDDDGLTNTIIKTITVEKAGNGNGDTGLNADFYWEPENPYILDNIKFISNSTDNGHIVDWKWVFEDNRKTGETTYTSYELPGNYQVTLTVTDNDGNTDTITKTITVKPRILEIDSFTCNPDIDDDGISDVVKGKELLCAIHIKDDIEDVFVDFDFNGTGDFPLCITDFKGQCNSELLPTDLPGTYSVNVTITKPGWISNFAGPLYVTIWEQKYEIKNLKVFEDEYNTEQYTYYRKDKMYVAFDVYDMITQEKILPGQYDDLIDKVYLKVHGDSAELDQWTKNNPAKSIVLKEIKQDDFISKLKNNFNYLFGINDVGMHKFLLEEIPITDDFLGQGKVFAFTINFTDNTAGEAAVNVNILNNELNFDLPEKLQVEKNKTYILDLNQYLTDIETPVNEILTSYGQKENMILNKLTNNQYKIFVPGTVDQLTTIFFTADDTDGSKITKSISLILDDGELILNEDPIAIIDVPEHTTINELLKISGKNSYDPDGYITDYSWKIVVAGETLFELSGQTETEINYVFDKKAIYHIFLTVTDNEGNTGTTEKKLDVREEVKFQGSQPGEEDGLWVDYFDVYGTNYGTITTEEEFTVQARVRNERKDTLNDVTVTFSLPEIGFQQSSQKYKLYGNGDYETINFMVELPYYEGELEHGEYIALITVKAKDILRTKYFPLYIE
ncbi:PKD domain-containing protein [Candidatus Woesearchaeota archaeon]|nr:PKD domain-containing protein [Candidatus Woesearchaeota archaeon]MCF7900666.1 PKD domain-containing protein [Candidatus Woesearchaeota archaeon]MCF8013499.1 PKD domain-containing protein [Candidatus Woesearchaeota archaeon]